MANNSAGSRQTTRAAVRGRKRTHAAQVYNYNGVHNSYEDKDNDFLCPICFEVIEEAHMTRCGHSFCRRCILRSLETSNRCPKCNFVIEKTDQIFPNFALNELILKYRQRVEEKRLKHGPQTGGPTPDVQEFIQDQEKWDLAEVNLMLEVLVHKKRKLEMDNQVAQIQILKDFLDEAKRKKQEQINELSAQMSILDSDIKRIEERMMKQRHAYNAMMSAFPMKAVNSNDIFLPSTSHSETSGKVEGAKPEGPQEGFNGSKNGGRQQWVDSTLASRRKKLYNHFDDLQSCYFSIRQSELTPCELRSTDMLDQFSENLSKFTKFSSMRPLATLSYADPYNGQSSIVSSIEFDKDNDFFAIAGVTKKIKVFEYGTVIMDAVDIHYPVHEMACSSKISCVAWSAYHKGVLASSDYEGTVTLWDAFAGDKTHSFQEHEKRCWSIDFNRMDPKLLASGSDDAKVKLWSTNQEQSITSLEAKANVCCVKFNPTKMYGLAFGSADHCVHYYDLRHPKQPLNVFKGHRKAVSYTKFVNSEEIVSASTDSQLKLWNVDKPHCLRTFRGHINEKNFVGLTSNDDYIACGSENNSLFVFYKGLSKQILTFKFDTVRSLMDKDKKEDDSNEFVSAVAWRTGSNVLVAANSQGTIKVLELV